MMMKLIFDFGKIVNQKVSPKEVLKCVCHFVIIIMSFLSINHFLYIYYKFTLQGSK